MMNCLLIKKDKSIIDITDVLSEVSFGGSIEQGGRTLEITVANDGTKYEVGDTVNYRDTDIDYVGQIQKNTNSNKQEVLEFEIVDYMSHWTRSKTTKVVNTTAESVAVEFCNYMGMAIGSIANTGIALKEKIYKDQSFYNIAKDLYDRAGAINGKQYYFKIVGAYFNVFEKGEILTYQIGDKINLDTIRKIEDISQLVNKVVVFDDKSRLIKEKTNETLGIVGLYQEVADKDDNIDEILTDVENTLEVSGIGDNSCQAGKYIRFEDSETGLTGIYEITEDSHTINSNGHLMTLRLKFIRIA